MVDETLLLALGIEVTEVKGSELWALCPGHLDRVGRVDSHPSWSINAETGVSSCFSCGYKASLSHLVADRLSLSPDDAKRWLTETIQVDFEALNRRLEDAREAYANPFRLVPMSEARLAVYVDPPQDALDARSLTLHACQQHTVRWDPKNDAWIIPIRDPDGAKLLGWQEKGQYSRSFRNRPAGVKKAQCLFGWERYTGGPLVVVESPLDVVRLTAMGPGVGCGVSPYGARVSHEQISMLRGADQLIVALDNDAAGIKASQEMWRTARDQGFECWFFDYSGTTAKDVGDMTDGEVLLGIANAKHCSAYGVSL